MSEQILSALRHSDFQSALALAEAHVLQSPTSPDGYYWLALAYQGLGAKADALTAINQAMALAPERDDLVMTRSIMLLADKDMVEAQSGLMDALTFNPNKTEAYVALIHIALGQGNLDEAKRLLRLVERVNAEDDNVLVAKAAIQQAAGNIDEALKFYTQASTKNPSNVMALSSLGLIYLKKDMSAFAEQALQRANTLAPGNIAILRALCQSQLNQQLFEAAEQTANNLLSVKPDDTGTLHLRAQLRQAHQDVAAALADVISLHALLPADANVLTQLITLLMQQGDIEQANVVMESALAKQPDNDEFWQLRCGLDASISGDSKQQIDRWLQQRPGSAMALEALSVYSEAKGDLPTAQNAAERALAISESLPMAQFVKLRQEVRDNPQAALDRVKLLANYANNPDSQRMIYAWLGIIYDRLQQYQQAADAFSQMANIVLPYKTLPVFSPAEHVPASGIAGRLLWAPVGARVERIFNTLAPELGPRLLVDRNQPSPAREDGFGPIRSTPGSADAGSALAWNAGINALGLQPETVVDWIPHWDGYTDAALAGAKLLAIIIDPRDAFINWMIFGSAQAYVFLPKTRASAKWLASSFHCIADTIERDPQTVYVIKIDDINSDAVRIAAELQHALKLESLPNAEALAKPIMALGGMPNQFSAGHWRHYKTYFSEAFDLLTPAAVRLGYPAD